MKISLIGDSIRMQYAPIVKEMLGDKFEIFTPEENCRFAKYNLRGMWDWKEGMKGSRIVHWNAGLWDICDIFGDGLFTSVDEYVKTMLRVADILLSRHDKVIFATTTPVRNNNPHNDNSEIIKYNEALVPELIKKGVIINNLHPLIYEDVDRFVSDDLIHLSEEGVARCAKQVYEFIMNVAEELTDEPTKNIEEAVSLEGVPVEFSNGNSN